MAAIAFIVISVPPASLAVRASGYFARWRCELTSDLPSVNVFDGDFALTLDTGKQWSRTGGVWVEDLVDPAVWGGIVGTLSDQTDLQTALDGKQVAGSYATGTGTANGTNTGDQTSIVGITGTLAQFNTALTGADFATGGGTVTGASSGTNTGDQVNISGNAATVTTNANLTGHVTSTGNAAVLGSFTVAQLNTALSDGDVATGGGTATGTNTGDNATNSQYSGLAASKQDTLVSGTNIKTINGSTVLGSGDLVVSGATNIKTSEQDFGTTPILYAEWVVSDGDVSSTSNIMPSLSCEVPVALRDGLVSDGDEAEMEPMNVFAKGMGTGTFTLVAEAMCGPVTGPYKFNYLIG